LESELLKELEEYCEVERQKEDEFHYKKKQIESRKKEMLDYKQSLPPSKISQKRPSSRTST